MSQLAACCINTKEQWETTSENQLAVSIQASYGKNVEHNVVSVYNLWEKLEASCAVNIT